MTIAISNFILFSKLYFKKLLNCDSFLIYGKFIVHKMSQGLYKY